MSKKWYDIDELKKHHINHCAQAGEDGLLQYIFENIEPKSKYAVEFGAGHMRGTPNVKWLVDKFEWTSLMFEIANKNDEGTKKKYGIKRESVDYKNINGLFDKYNVPDDVDIVVIDVDGQDYWIWEALEWKPQIVEIEYNSLLNITDSKVMHKDTNHYKWRQSKSGYYGASILALKKLGKEKGYTLIDICGRNCFFILDELVEDGYDVNISDLDLEVTKPDEKRGNTKDDRWVEV